MLINLLELKGLIYNNSELIYIINIPNFSNETYQVYKVIPIPIQSTFIYPKPPEIIILNDYHFTTKIDTCQTIYNIYYCMQDQLSLVENSCTPAIIQQQRATCNFTTQKPAEFITQLDENRIIVIPNAQPIEFTSNCSRNTNKILQTSIITIQNCYIQIHQNLYQAGNIKTFKNLQKSLPWNEIVINETFPEPNLVEFHNWTLQNIELLHFKSSQTTLHTSTGHISFGFLITIIIIFSIVKFRKYIMSTSIFRKKSNADLRGEELRHVTISDHLNTHSAKGGIIDETESHTTNTVW